MPVSCSPATTWAAVTTRSRVANHPLPSIPTPHAVPRTRTTSPAPETAMCAGGGELGGVGPAIEGNGSMRASSFRRRRGGTAWSRRRTTSDCCTSRRRLDCPGTSSAVALRTQTRTTPETTPRTRPPKESMNRSGERRRPPRTSEPAMPAAVWRRIAPSTAPMSPARGVYPEPAPPCRRCGATREPAYAPPASPASESAVTTSPRRIPPRAVNATIPSAIQSTTLGFTEPVSRTGGTGPGYNAPSLGA